ncbi:uncharacterized protein LOC142346206 [Convolutriloba macropyga]|uniref:uncharacterized protein LOC142346206 n=1 Tax=Convolutriloba macropyga TaxID=536237 RepID=UPI003F51D30E
MDNLESGGYSGAISAGGGGGNQLAEEMKFFMCSRFLFPWIKQSLSLDVIQSGSKEPLTVFAKLSADILDIIDGRKLKLFGDEEPTIMARFYSDAFITFPHFYIGLSKIRRLNLQIKNLSLCYTSKHLAHSKYRNAFDRIVEGILGHTVHVQSGLRKYYFEFGLLLQQLVQFYHQGAHDPQFNFNSVDVNFLLVVFENVKFWLDIGKSHWQDDHHSAELTGGSFDDHDQYSTGHQDSCNRILSSAVEFIQLVSSLNLMEISRDNVNEFARTVRQVLKIAFEVLEFAEQNLPSDYFMLKVHISVEIYKFLYQEDIEKTSVFKALMDKQISPEKSCDQYIYVFELLFQVCQLLVCADHFKLENMNIVKQNILRKCILEVDQPDVIAAADPDSPFLDIRHSLAYLLKTLHDSIIWPMVLSRPGNGKFFSRPYPLDQVLHMSLASPEIYTLSSLCSILADSYCLQAKINPQAFSELVREVDTFIGFKHKMGDQLYVDRFKAKLISTINSSPLIEIAARSTEVKRIESITSVQMKDLLNIRSSAESGLDPDLLILYTNDLLKFYAGDKLYKLDVDLSSNVLFIRYHMRIYSLNVEFNNTTSAAETLMEFVILLERFDDKNRATRPNSVDHLKDEVPSEFFQPGYTTVEMSIELLKKAADLYEKQKLYEAADYARDQLNNFYYRNLDYEGIALNNIHRAQLACKIKGISLREKVEEILPNEGKPVVAPLKTGKQNAAARKQSTLPDETVSNVKIIHTRGFQLQFYMVKFPRSDEENKIHIPKVFEGKSFIYSRDNMLSTEFESYLKSLFPDCGPQLRVVREEHDKTVGPTDIVYAPLHPQLWLPKRFKTQLFVPSSSPDVEFYRTHSISMFEKRIPVQEVKELKDLEFETETALMMFNADSITDEKKKQKEIDEWKKALKASAVFGMKVTKYKLSDQNLVNQSENELYPGKCRWQPIIMSKPATIKYSCEIAKLDIIEFIQQLSDIYYNYNANQNNPKKQLEHLKGFMELISKIVSPIQGGLKKQCLAFLSVQYREIVGTPRVKGDFEKFLIQLLQCLVVISRTIEQFVESNRDDETLKAQAREIDLLVSAAGQYDMHLASIFNDDIVKPNSDHAKIMNEVKEFLRQEHLNRIMKTDPCIHEQDRKLTSYEWKDLDCIRNADSRASSLIEKWNEKEVGAKL